MILRLDMTARHRRAMGAALAYALSRVDELNEQLLAAGADPVLPADLTFVGDAFDRAVDAQARQMGLHAVPCFV